MLFSVPASQAQTREDSLLLADDLLIDTSLDYDAFFADLDQFLDSLLSPRSYFIATIGASQGYFNFKEKGQPRLEVRRKYILSPSAGYFSKSGLGISVTGDMVNDGNGFRFYQFSISPSFDFVRNRDLAAGFAYQRFFTRDSLSFYTSPLQNELSGYFIWRKSWVQPGLAMNAGWGSRKDYVERETFIDYLRARRLRLPFPIPTTTEEETSIMDFTVTASARHSFYWLRLLDEKDFLRFTPILALSAGTRKFGFNRTTSTTLGNYTLRDFNLEENQRFQPISLTTYLRAEYNIGKVFIQPQLILDYYFPANDKRITSVISVTAGILVN
jgi:hypothetical protein